MTRAVEQVKSLIEAVRITTPTSFTWLGAESPRLAPEMRKSLSPAMARRCLHALLRQQLYQDFYIRGEVSPAPRMAAHQGGAALATPFIDALSAANAGQGSWQTGWTVRSVLPDGIVASNGALTLFVPRDEYRPVDPTGSVSLRFPKEARRISPGFYMAEGDTVPVAGEQIVRLYWHLRPEGAVVLMREITTRLNAARVPFRFKVVNNPEGYVRCDAGVLYLRQCDYAAASPILARVYTLVADNLGPQTPVFTKTLAPGLGLAEDPGDGESFGQHRCDLLAEGLIRAHEAGQQTVAGRLAVIRRAFADAGVDLDRPYLRPGSVDHYEFRTAPSASTSVPIVPVGRLPVPQASFLDAARHIGHRLAREAIWHGDRCTWMTTDLVPQTDTGRFVATARPLGPDLYAGASGVALFLAELAAQTGEELIHRTALGAIRQASARAEDVPPEARGGLYTGWVGVAGAAVRTGVLLDELDVVAGGAALLRRAMAEPWDERMTDLLAGRAGALAGALALRPVIDDDAIIGWARAAGDDLLRVAHRSGTALSWASHVSYGQSDLTGFSHGAAGIGYALLDLFAATGEQRYLEGARQSLAYERQWFDEASGNWADLRHLPRRTKPGRRHLPSMVAWCHGAPGIALARLRAWEQLGDAAARAEASVGLETTARAVRAAMERSDGDCTLCHGLLGNADVLAIGGRMLGDPALTALAHAAGARCIAAYGDGRQPWPCGGHTGELPGLMLGLAGIGHFFLRLHDPAVPSVLLPGVKPARRASGQAAREARLGRDLLVMV